MNYLKTILLLSFSFLFLAVHAQDKSLPSVNVKTLEGQTVDMQDFAKNGKITVISFWATWCAPCKKELDAIADVYVDWQDDYDMELVAVSIDTRRAAATIPALVATKGWEYEVLIGKQTELMNAFNFQTIPQTVLVDQAGNIVYRHSGYVPGDEFELEDKIIALTE